MGQRVTWCARFKVYDHTRLSLITLVTASCSGGYRGRWRTGARSNVLSYTHPAAREQALPIGNRAPRRMVSAKSRRAMQRMKTRWEGRARGNTTTDAAETYADGRRLLSPGAVEAYAVPRSIEGAPFRRESSQRSATAADVRAWGTPKDTVRVDIDSAIRAGPSLGLLQTTGSVRGHPRGNRVRISADGPSKSTVSRGRSSKGWRGPSGGRRAVESRGALAGGNGLSFLRSVRLSRRADG